MKIVFDTLIYLSAFSVRQGSAEDALLKTIENRDELIISREMINSILSRLSARLHQDRDALTQVALYLESIASIVHPPERLSVFLERSGNQTLECASAGRADTIVTCSRKVLKLGEHEGIRIVSLTGYLGLS